MSLVGPGPPGWGHQPDNYEMPSRARPPESSDDRIAKQHRTTLLYVAESRFIWSHSSDSRFFSFASSGGHWQPSVAGTGQVPNPANGNCCWDGAPSYSRSVRFGPCRLTRFGPVGRAVSARHIAGSQRLRGSTSGKRKSRSPGRVSYFESFRPSSSRPSLPTE
jgi:hypothetical protein